MPRPTVLVTGATGLVGQALCPALGAAGWRVRRALRAAGPSSSTDSVVIGDIGPDTSWSRALEDVDTVVHLAARVHCPGDHDLDAFRRVNVAGTLRLAEDALRRGVRRLVYVSSVKVLGESSPPERPFVDSDAPRPADEYALSKFEAEQALRALGGSLELVILRPPLVYGPMVKANFLQLMRWIDRGVWLPFGAIENRRSLVYAGNLASAITECLTHPAAAGMTFLVSDAEQVSTPDLVARISTALGRSSRCVAVPVPVLRTAAMFAGMRAQAERLLDSLAVDPALIANRIGWHPPHSLEHGLGATAAWYRTQPT